MSEHYHYSWYIEEPIIVWKKPDKYKNISSSETKSSLS